MDIKKEAEEGHEGMWTLMEMELSLSYDLLYTKAGVIHTWSGYGICVASSLAAAASILLFWFSSKDGHNPVDVAISYTLLAGALLFETGSLLRAVESSWTYAFLCNTRWNWLRYAAADRSEGGPARLGNTTCFMFPATATEPTTHWWAELLGC